MIKRQLQKWYMQNKRNLPWRETQNPYNIWISEIILQQTRVIQGYDYYMRFIDRFPNVSMLADADENEVLVLWQGLGYYSRARNLHFAAKTIVEKFDGVFPYDYNDIIKLKGIGEYTAAAIASFAYNQPYAVVDGNVFRFLSRLFGVDTPIDTSRGKKEFSALATQLLDKDYPGLHNQAIMEFGALHCTPDNPNCETCPFCDICIAYNKDKIKLLPVKQGKTKTRERFFNYFDVRYGNDLTLLLNKRTQKDIWQNLYELPLLETTQKLELKELLNTKAFQELFPSNCNIEIHHTGKSMKHILSHQTLNAVFYRIYIPKKEICFLENFVEVDICDLHNFPISRLVDRYFEQTNVYCYKDER